MRRIIARLLPIVCFLASCQPTTPETYFDQAVLNTNLLHGFASRGLRQELESPSVKLAETGKGETIPMQRKEVLENDIASIEVNFEKVKKLPATDDARDILQASTALYEFVLPVYKTEYRQLARLYDEAAPREEIDALAAAIETKYRAGFAKLSQQLVAAGKPYAQRHGIRVNWDIATEPAP